MVTLRCTQKLLRRLDVSPRSAVAPPTTVLGDWYANLVFARPQQLVLCMNERSLLLVIVPARESKTLAQRFRDAAIAHLRRIGVPDAAVDAEAREMGEIGIGPTANRRVLGCLNEAAFALSVRCETRGFSSLEDLQLYFAGFLFSPNGGRYPREVALELFGAAGAETPSIH